MHLLKLIVGGTVLSSVATPLTLAHTIHFVPQEHPTIVSAVGNAQDGDTIVISGGTYAEDVVVDGFTNLTIQGKGKVIIDPPGDEAGLTLSNCTDCTVINVRTTGAAIGIQLLACTGGSLLKCRAEAVTGIGIALDECDGVTVEACTIEDSVGDGIALGATIPSINCTLRKNKVFGAGDDGIDVSGDNNTIEDCLVKESTADGYRTESEPPATGNIFTGCKAIVPGGHGFRIQGDDNVMQKCKAIKAGENGAQLAEGTGHVVQDCTFIKPAFDGIFGVDTALTVTVSSNTFKKPSTNGMDIDGDDATAVDNKCTKSGGNGYAIIGDNGTWTGNSAKGSQDDGFQISGTGNVLTFNKAKGSKDGFDLNDQSGGLNDVDETNKFGTVGP